MRKIDRTIKNAFWAKQALTVSNTRCTGDQVYLHGNLILERCQDGIWATLAGWNTPTTRRRLNAILEGRAIIYCYGKCAYLSSNGELTSLGHKEWFRIPNQHD